MPNRRQTICPGTTNNRRYCHEKGKAEGLLISERMLLLRRVEMGGIPVKRSVSPFSRAALSLLASAQAASSSSGCSTETCHVKWACALQLCQSACLCRWCDHHISVSITMAHSGAALSTALAHPTWCICRPLPPLGCPWLDASAWPRPAGDVCFGDEGPAKSALLRSEL